MMRHIAMDLEMNQPSGNIIQIGIAYTDALGFGSSKSFLIPLPRNETLDPYIIRLTGITPGDLERRAVSFQEACAQIKELLDEGGFNSQVITWGKGDLKKFHQAAAQANIPPKDTPWDHTTALNLQSVVSFQEMTEDGKSRNYSLKTACGIHNVKMAVPAHDAEMDAVNTLNLFLEMRRKALVFQRFVKQVKAM